MASLVLTVIGDDRSGLVDRLAGVVADHGGNWDKSQMSRLAGKFAGIVLVSVADAKVDALVADLQPLEAEGLLDVSVERITESPASLGAAANFALELVGQDQPGIMSDISRVLAEQAVSIEELRTETVNAPMAGGAMFRVEATVRVPDGVSVTELEQTLEELPSNLMVEVVAITS